jgi:hypothetical protein
MLTEYLRHCLDEQLYITNLMVYLHYDVNTINTYNITEHTLGVA